MALSVRQLQDRYREHRQPVNLAFIEMAKALGLVSRDGLFALLPTDWVSPRAPEHNHVLPPRHAFPSENGMKQERHVLVEGRDYAKTRMNSF